MANSCDAAARREKTTEEPAAARKTDNPEPPELSWNRVKLHASCRHHSVWLCARCGAPFEEAIAKTKLRSNRGFRVLCQIDIQAKLKEKLGVDFRGT